jgi:hypothetical protein
MNTSTFLNRFALGAAIVVLLGLLWVPNSSAEAIMEAAVGEDRIWLDTLRSEPGRRQSLAVSHPKNAGVTSPLEFVTDVVSTDSGDRVNVHLVVTDSAGGERYAGSVNLELEKGSNPCRFTWIPEDLEDGLYYARFDVVRQPATIACSRTLAVRKYNEFHLAAQLEAAETATKQLQDHMELLAGEGVLPPYALVRMAVASDFLPLARTHFDGGDWRWADVISKFALKTVDTVRSELMFSRKHIAPSPNTLAQKISIRQGAYHNGERPVFLIGATSDETPGLPARYGMNLIATQFGPRRTLANGDPWRSEWNAIHAAADAGDLAVLTGIAPSDVGEALLSKHPSIAQKGEGLAGINVRDTRYQALLRNHLETLMPAYAQSDRVIGVSLARNPTLQIPLASMRSEFLKLALAFYGDLDTLKQAWRVRVEGMEEIQVGWDSGRIAYQYDLHRYHQYVVTEFFTDIASRIKDYTGESPVHVEFADDFFVPGSRRRGIDYGALTQQMHASAFTANVSDEHPLYHMTYPGPFASMQLLESMAPDSPVLISDLDIQVSDDPYATHIKRFARAVVWEAAMHGVDGIAARMGSIAKADAGGMLVRPELIEGYATAGMDLNRLAELVQAFQKADAEVAVLWSPASAIFEGGERYMASVLRAFDGCSKFGRKVRFITEDQAAAGQFQGVQVLVVPRTPAVHDTTFAGVRQFVEEGGFLIRAESGIPYTPRGFTRLTLLPHDRRTVLVRGGDTADNYTDAMDTAEERGLLKPTVRPTREFGYALSGVRSQYLSREDGDFLYVINMAKESRHCYLPKSPPTGHDLILGRAVEFPLILSPLDPMLIKLDRVPIDSEEAESALLAEGPANSTPSVTLTKSYDAE